MTTTITRKGGTGLHSSPVLPRVFPVLASGQRNGASVCAAGGFFAAHTSKDKASAEPFHVFPRGTDLYGLVPFFCADSDALACIWGRRSVSTRERRVCATDHIGREFA